MIRQLRSLPSGLHGLSPRFPFVLLLAELFGMMAGAGAVTLQPEVHLGTESTQSKQQKSATAHGSFRRQNNI